MLWDNDSAKFSRRDFPDSTWMKILKIWTYVLRRSRRRATRSTVIQPRGGAWSGRTISCCSPSRHHYTDHQPVRAVVLRRVYHGVFSTVRKTRPLPAQASLWISLSPARWKRPAVIRAKESGSREHQHHQHHCNTNALCCYNYCLLQQQHHHDRGGCVEDANSASAMQRHARSLQFVSRDEAGHRAVVRLAQHPSYGRTRRSLHRSRPFTACFLSTLHRAGPPREEKCSGNLQSIYPRISR